METFKFFSSILPSIFKISGTGFKFILKLFTLVLHVHGAVVVTHLLNSLFKGLMFGVFYFKV